jgi:transcriptional activator SPT7
VSDLSRLVSRYADQTQPFRDDRPNLASNLDEFPAFTRTPFSMIASTSHLGPTYAEKGKARELAAANTAPAWYPAEENNETRRVEGIWYSAMGRDEAYIGGLPATTSMAAPVFRSVKRIPTRRRPAPLIDSADPRPPEHKAAASPKRTVNLETIVHRTVDELYSARMIANSIYEWQKLEMDGGLVPPIKRFDREKALRKEEEAERRRIGREEAMQANKRRRLGGEVGENEAALAFKRATAGMMAHAGFDGMSSFRLDLTFRCQRGGTGFIYSNGYGAYA